MAFTLLMAEGFETGGFERCSTAGTYFSIDNTNVRAAANGSYCVSTGGGTLSTVDIDIYEFQGTANSNAKGLGFWFKKGVASWQLTDLVSVFDGAGQRKFYLSTNYAGGLNVYGASGTVIAYTPAGFDYADGEWHFVEFWYEDGSSSAAWELVIDGVSELSDTDDLRASNTSRLRLGSSSIVMYWDDFYFGEATAASDLLGDMDIFATTGDGSATTGGDALDFGTWANTQEIPGNDTYFARYEAQTSTTTEDLYPDGSVFSLTNLSGAYTDVDEDPDSPDANWLTAPGSNNNTAVRASFPTPSGAPTGTQTFRVWVRKTNHSTNCTAVVELWETGGGAALATVVASTTVSSTTGQMLSGTWNASSLGTANGSAVEIRIAGAVGGGGPSNRSSLEVGAIEWVAAVPGPTPARSGWIEADSGTRAGPSGMTGLDSIIGMSTFIRTFGSVLGSEPGQSLYRGNDTDGLTELVLPDVTASNADFFDITQSAAIVPSTSEHSRVGYGHPANSDSTLICREAITMVVHVATTTQSYTLEASPGSYSLTGQAADLLRGLILEAASGSYSYTGSAAGIARSFILAAESGAYSVAGQAAELLRALNLDAEAGSYSLTGQAADLDASFRFELEAGSYTITGHDSAFRLGVSLAAEAGSYSVSGQAATLALYRHLGAEAGSYSLTGQDAALQRGLVAQLDAGSYSLTGQPVEFDLGKALGVDAGSYSLVGADLDLQRGLRLQLDAGSYELTGQALGFGSELTLQLDSGTYTLSGQDVALKRGLALPSDAGAYSLTGQDASFSRALILGAEAGSYTLTGVNVALSALGNYQVALAAGSYTLTGQDLNTRRALVMRGFHPKINLAGSYGLQGYAVNLTYTPAADEGGGGGGGTLGFQARQQAFHHQQQLRDEDELILRVIRTFLEHV